MQTESTTNNPPHGTNEMKMKRTNFDRLYRHTPANKLSDDELKYISWMKQNSPDSPCYDPHGIEDARFYCNCAVVNILLGRAIW